MQNFNECLDRAGQNAPTSENGQRYDTLPDTDETIKITAKIIADFADWVRVYGAFAAGFLSAILCFVLVNLVGVML